MALPIDASTTPLEITTAAIAGPVLVIDASDTPLETFATAGLTRYPYIYVCDSGNHRIQVFNYSGTLLFTFGSYGSGNGQFNTPFGVVFDGTYVYVTDTNNNRVQVFTPMGVYVTQFGSGGTALGQFSGPMGIHVDDRFIWVVDSGNNRFQVITKSEYLAFYEHAESEGITFNAPTDCWGDTAWFFVLDDGNNRTCVFSKNLNFIISGASELPALTMGTGAIIKNNSSYGLAVIAPLMMYSPGATMETISVMTGDGTLPALSVSGSITTTHVSTGASELPGIESSGEMTTARTMTGDSVFPALQSSGTIQRLSVIIGDSVLPALIVSATMYTVRSSPGVYGLAMNIKNKAFSTYDNYNFNSFAHQNGKLYGASSSGIHLLEGDDDNGTNIDASFKTGRIDTHEGNVRRVVDAIISARIAGTGFLKLHEKEGDTNSIRPYPIIGNKSEIHDEIIDFARGHRGRYHEYEFENEDGVDFDVKKLVVRSRDIGRTR